VKFTDAAIAQEARLSPFIYDRMWDRVEKILADPEAGKHASWTNYVSSQRMWGSRVAGTDYTVFWTVDGDVLWVELIVEDPGL